MYLSVHLMRTMFSQIDHQFLRTLSRGFTRRLEKCCTSGEQEGKLFSIDNHKGTLQFIYTSPPNSIANRDRECKDDKM